MDGEQQQLFGSPAGKVKHLVVRIDLDHLTGRSKVVLDVESEMRRRPMLLLVQCEAHDTPGAVLGLMMPVVHRGWYASAERVRCMLWDTFRRLGTEGYEAEIIGCGSDPRKRI